MTEETPEPTPLPAKLLILGAALRCFVRHGAAATRLMDVAREAGVSKGGIYHHFRTKTGLFHDTVRRVFEQVEQQLQLAEPIGVWPEQVAALARIHLEACMLPPTSGAPPAAFGYADLLVLAREQALRDRTCEALLVEHLDWVAGRYAALIPAVAVAPDSPVVVARALLYFVAGVAALGDVSKVFDASEAESLIFNVLDALVHRRNDAVKLALADAVGGTSP